MAYLNQQYVTSSTYVGWDGLTPPTLPIPPWYAVAGVQPADFKLGAVFSSVTLVQGGSANNFLVESTTYPVSTAQQIIGFRIGGWIAFSAINGNNFFVLDNKAGRPPHSLGLNVDGSSNWSLLGRINETAFVSVSVAGPVINSWQFIALEVFNNTVTFYGDFTGHSTINPPPADQSENVTVYKQYFGGANQEILYPGVACYRQSTQFLHLRLTFFAAPPSAGSLPSTLPSGIAGGFVPYTPYARYKNIRQAVQTFNQLVLTP